MSSEHARVARCRRHGVGQREVRPVHFVHCIEVDNLAEEVGEVAFHRVRHRGDLDDERSRVRTVEVVEVLLEFYGGDFACGVGGDWCTGSDASAWIGALVHARVVTRHVDVEGTALAGLPHANVRRAQGGHGAQTQQAEEEASGDHVDEQMC